MKLRRPLREGTESLVAKRRAENPAIGEHLMEEVCEREHGDTQTADCAEIGGPVQSANSRTDESDARRQH